MLGCCWVSRVKEAMAIQEKVLGVAGVNRALGGRGTAGPYSWNYPQNQGAETRTGGNLVLKAGHGILNMKLRDGEVCWL